MIGPEQFTALFDSREKHRLDLSPLRTEQVTLTTGDYTVKGLEHVVAIERKSEGDLLACVGRERERFEREVQRLLAFPVRALVVESSWKAMEAGLWRGRIMPNQAIGSLLGWQAMGLPVLMLDSHERCGRYVSRLLYTVARRRWRENQQLLSTLGDSHE